MLLEIKNFSRAAINSPVKGLNMIKGDKFKLEFCPMPTLGRQGEERIELIGMK